MAQNKKQRLLWGVFNYSAKHGLVRSLVFLGLMLAGISYAVMIGTESYLLQEMWGIVL